MAITAVTEAPPGLSLVFGVGDLLCAIALRDVVETIRPLPAQPGAGTSEFLLGVSVIRGLAVPVIDTARLLGARVERPYRFVTTRTEAYATGPVIGVLPVEPDPGRPPPPTTTCAAPTARTRCAPTSVPTSRLQLAGANRGQIQRAGGTCRRSPRTSWAQSEPGHGATFSFTLPEA